jgi:hypothetical protein
VAVTDRAALIVTTQFPVPVHAPLHPVNVDVASGAAVNVTCVPASNHTEQVDPQEIRVGNDVTLPSPVPLRVTLRIY